MEGVLTVNVNVSAVWHIEVGNRSITQFRIYVSYCHAFPLPRDSLQYSSNCINSK
jgi:hypothetical protein